MPDEQQHLQGDPDHDAAANRAARRRKARADATIAALCAKASPRPGRDRDELARAVRGVKRAVASISKTVASPPGARRPLARAPRGRGPQARPGVRRTSSSSRTASADPGLGDPDEPPAAAGAAADLDQIARRAGLKHAGAIVRRFLEEVDVDLEAAA